ncbi:MAG: sigma-54 dependent transcriptional regulator [Pseudomonadota bacterium]
MNKHILVADDDPQQRRYLCAVLSASGYTVTAVEDGQPAVDAMVAGGPDQPDLALLDIQMPGMDGMTVVTNVRARDVRIPILMLTADGSVTRAVEAMRAGADDFLIKPAGPERLDTSIRNALKMSDLSTEVRRLARTEENRLSFEELIAIAAPMRDAIAMARRAARSEIPILIEGESGSGKEIFARAIHGSSDRAGKPFIAVNCGALPAQLVESILFGHEKGAFTGATERRAGKFQDADGGTLFLDEVGELPLDSQVKLLRAIQTGEIDPVGASQSVSVNIRLISATNRDLSTMIDGGTFREDLFYRLGVFPLHLPPLRERREDIPGLARMFLKRFATAEGAPVDSFSQAALEAIAHAPWPGNVRQLENTIHRAVVMAEGLQIRPSDLVGLGKPGDVALDPVHTDSPAAGLHGTPHMAGHIANPFVTEDGHIRRLFDIEADAIAKALTLYRGRMSETARRLGIGRSTLYRKIEELQIDKHAS